MGLFCHEIFRAGHSEGGDYAGNWGGHASNNACNTVYYF